MAHSSERFYAVEDSRGQRHAVRMARKVRYVTVIHPKPEQSVFKRSLAVWHKSMAVAVEEARAWARIGYEAEQLTAEEVDEREWSIAARDRIQPRRVLTA